MLIFFSFLSFLYSLCEIRIEGKGEGQGQRDGSTAAPWPRAAKHLSCFKVDSLR